MPRLPAVMATDWPGLIFSLELQAGRADRGLRRRRRPPGRGETAGECERSGGCATSVDSAANRLVFSHYNPSPPGRGRRRACGVFCGKSALRLGGPQRPIDGRARARHRLSSGARDRRRPAVAGGCASPRPRRDRATRSSRFGRKIVSSASGKYQAMCSPPPLGLPELRAQHHRGRAAHQRAQVLLGRPQGQAQAHHQKGHEDRECDRTGAIRPMAQNPSTSSNVDLASRTSAAPGPRTWQSCRT